MSVPVLNRTISRYRTEYTMIIIMIVNACVIMKTRHAGCVELILHVTLIVSEVMVGSIKRFL